MPNNLEGCYLGVGHWKARVAFLLEGGFDQTARRLKGEEDTSYILREGSSCNKRPDKPCPGTRGFPRSGDDGRGPVDQTTDARISRGSCETKGTGPTLTPS